jgi:acyl-CoA dehydrogenase
MTSRDESLGVGGLVNQSVALSSDDHIEAVEIAAAVEQFVRHEVIPYERDSRSSQEGPTEDLVRELRAKARHAGVLTPHIVAGSRLLSQRSTALILRKSGLSPLGPVACNTAAPDEGNMHLLSHVASPAQKQRYLDPLVRGEVRSAFLMTEPAVEDGAGSDPSMLKTVARRQGEVWHISGRKTFITGFLGASWGIVIARTSPADSKSATLFLVDLPNAAIHLEHVVKTIDSASVGGHACVRIDDLVVPESQVLGEADEGFRYAQVRLSPARLSHCMRWHGAATRAHEIAANYACRRTGFGKKLIEHEGVGFMLADNLIDLKQAELMIDWCAGVLDGGSLGVTESSMTKVAVSEALFRVADRCVQTMGGTGVSRETIVEQVFREIRSFRIYDGPNETHRWSLAKKVRRDTESTDLTPPAELS